MINLSEGELTLMESALKEALLVVGRIKKRRNAYATIEKVKMNDSHVGRPRKRNDLRIQKLRSKGLTIRKIAQLEGVSTTAVQRSLSEKAKAEGPGE